MLEEKLKELRNLINEGEKEINIDENDDTTIYVKSMNFYSCDNKNLTVEITYYKEIYDTHNTELENCYEEEYTYSTKEYNVEHVLSNVDYTDIVKSSDLLKSIIYAMKDIVKDYVDINNKEISKEELEILNKEIVLKELDKYLESCK